MGDPMGAVICLSSDDFKKSRKYRDKLKEPLDRNCESITFEEEIIDKIGNRGWEDPIAVIIVCTDDMNGMDIGNNVASIPDEKIVLVRAIDGSRNQNTMPDLLPGQQEADNANNGIGGNQFPNVEKFNNLSEEMKKTIYLDDENETDLLELCDIIKAKVMGRRFEERRESEERRQEENQKKSGGCIIV